MRNPGSSSYIVAPPTKSQLLAQNHAQKTESFMGFDGSIGQASIDDFIDRNTQYTEKKASGSTMPG